MVSTGVIGVVGGSGGVGASVLSAAIAVRAAAADRVAVCVDGDRLGGGLDVTFGLEQEAGLRWPDLARARGRVDGAELLLRLPSVDGVAVLSFDRHREVSLEAEVVQEIVSAVARAADLVVLDLPRPGDALFEVWAGLVDAVVLLSGPEARDLAASSCIAPVVSGACAEVWLCLRGTGRAEFADSVAAALDLPLLARVRDDGALRADQLHGIPPGTSARGALARAADHVLAQLTPGTGRVAS